MASKKIAILVGSIRKESLNRKMANALVALAPKSLAFEFFEIGGLPLYNQDLDESPPEAWTDFKTSLRSVDGVIFVTPEYNRSIPGVLKNAIDVGSRPYGQSSWEGKPGAVITVSPGSIGGFGANHHLRQVLVFLNVPCMQQPEAYMGDAGALFDSQGAIVDESTRKFVIVFMKAFSEWVSKTSRAAPQESQAA